MGSRSPAPRPRPRARPRPALALSLTRAGSLACARGLSAPARAAGPTALSAQWFPKPHTSRAGRRDSAGAGRTLGDRGSCPRTNSGRTRAGGRARARTPPSALRPGERDSAAAAARGPAPRRRSAWSSRRARPRKLFRAGVRRWERSGVAPPSRALSRSPSRTLTTPGARVPGVLFPPRTRTACC